MLNHTLFENEKKTKQQQVTFSTKIPMNSVLCFGFFMLSSLFFFFPLFLFFFFSNKSKQNKMKQNKTLIPTQLLTTLKHYCTKKNKKPEKINLCPLILCNFLTLLYIIKTNLFSRLAEYTVSQTPALKKISKPLLFTSRICFFFN